MRTLPSTPSLPPVTTRTSNTLTYAPPNPKPKPRAAKLIMISNNCPAIRKSEIEYYAMLAKCTVHHYSGSNVALGTSCGKMFRCSALSVTDQGDSEILSTIE